MTTSLLVAEVFGKEHKEVLKVIRRIEDVDDDREGNFALSLYTKETGNGTTRNYPMYEITKDGFTFLAMGFTGAKAAQFKQQYIEAFNRMEEHIRNQQFNPAKLSRLEILQMAIEAEQKVLQPF